MSCLRDVTADIRCPAVLGVECVAHKVEAPDAETIGLVIVDVRFLEADNVYLLSFCNGADEVALRGRQTLNVKLQYSQCWTDVLKATVQVRRIVFMYLMCTGIHDTLGLDSVWLVITLATSGVSQMCTGRASCTLLSSSPHFSFNSSVHCRQ
jgi:hypothetical protein